MPLRPVYLAGDIHRATPAGVESEIYINPVKKTTVQNPCYPMQHHCARSAVMMESQRSPDQTTNTEITTKNTKAVDEVPMFIELYHA